MAPLSTLDMNACTFVHDCNDQVNTTMRAFEKPLNPSSTGKSVSFSADVTTHHIIHRDEFQPAEKAAAWYCAEELREIKESVRKIVQLMETGEDGECCTRGLEARTRAGATRKRHNKLRARTAVIFEQEHQDWDGICDPEAIADKYYNYSEPCQVAAEMMARRDEKEAKAALSTSKFSFVEYSYDKVVLGLQQLTTIALSA